MKSLFARKPSEPVKRKVNLADPERLAALKRLKVMDTPPEESLDPPDEDRCESGRRTRRSSHSD